MQQLTSRRKNFGNKAPVIEAVVDIRVVTPEDLDLNTLKGFNADTSDRFPIRSILTQFASQVSMTKDSGASISTSHTAMGFSFKSAKEDRVVQVRRDGLTLSKLAPYEGWENLREEAEDLWIRFKTIASPRSITRLAVRYINEFHLPPGTIAMHEWFTLWPNMPQELQLINEFVVKASITHPEEPSYRAIITQVAPAREADAQSTAVLDIDVFAPVNMPTTAEVQLWQIFEDLRMFKNDIFFCSLTEKTEGLFL